jgi:hypothetical protein
MNMEAIQVTLLDESDWDSEDVSFCTTSGSHTCTHSIEVSEDDAE